MEILDEEIKFWLETTFQNTIEVCLQLSSSSAPEETPFIHKYEAIEKLKSLLDVNHPLNFIVYCALG